MKVKELIETLSNYDEIMRHCGVLKKTEHWNEDVYADANGDW